MSFYAKNPHDDPGTSLDDEESERLERCEAEAMRYFRDATKEALQQRRQTVADLQPYWNTPKYRRLYAQASEQYETAVKPAHALYLLTLAELELTGEVSEEISEAWDRLKAAQALENFIAIGERLFADQIEFEREMRKQERA